MRRYRREPYLHHALTRTDCEEYRRCPDLTVASRSAPDLSALVCCRQVPSSICSPAG